MTFSKKDLTYLTGNWTEEELDIFVLFHGRCGLNRAHRASVLHEIIPKSRSPKNWNIPTNRIPLCNDCHVLVHGKYDATIRNKLQTIRLEAEYANSTT